MYILFLFSQRTPYVYGNISIAKPTAKTESNKNAKHYKTKLHNT